MNDTAESTSKRLRITTSDGSSKTILLPTEATYGDLQSMIEKEFNILCDEQILRSGIPPKIIVPPSDPSQPVALNTGDRVTVETSAKNNKPVSEGTAQGDDKKLPGNH